MIAKRYQRATWCSNTPGPRRPVDPWAGSPRLCRRTGGSAGAARAGVAWRGIVGLTTRPPDRRYAGARGDRQRRGHPLGRFSISTTKSEPPWSSRPSSDRRRLRLWLVAGVRRRRQPRGAGRRGAHSAVFVRHRCGLRSVRCACRAGHRRPANASAGTGLRVLPLTLGITDLAVRAAPGTTAAGGRLRPLPVAL